MIKRKIILLFTVIGFLFSGLIVYLNKDMVLQRGNPLPYLIAAVQISEKNPYVLVDETKGIYISERGKCAELFDHFQKKTGLQFVEQAGSGYIFTDGIRNDVISSEVYWGRYTVWTLPDIEFVN